MSPMRASWESAQVLPRFLQGFGETMGTAMSADSPRVLVVDDEPNIVDVITMALRYQGFEVASAGHGHEALAAVESFRPQLMILDVMLPDMEGFEVAARLGAERGARADHLPDRARRRPRTSCAA